MVRVRERRLAAGSSERATDFLSDHTTKTLRICLLGYILLFTADSTATHTLRKCTIPCQKLNGPLAVEEHQRVMPSILRPTRSLGELQSRISDVLKQFLPSQPR